MCTVSHCRVILPVGYEYLRCERHRIQNRHHSKLKRVRDKDAKAQALEGFFATLTGSASPPGMYPMSQSFDDQEGPELFEEGSSGQDNQIPIAELYRMDEQKRAEVVDLNVVEPQVGIVIVTFQTEIQDGIGHHFRSASSRTRRPSHQPRLLH